MSGVLNLRRQLPPFLLVNEHHVRSYFGRRRDGFRFAPVQLHHERAKERRVLDGGDAQPLLCTCRVDRYWQFHIEQDQRRLYPGVWAVVPK